MKKEKTIKRGSKEVQFGHRESYEVSERPSRGHVTDIVSADGSVVMSPVAAPVLTQRRLSALQELLQREQV